MGGTLWRGLERLGLVGLAPQAARERAGRDTGGTGLAGGIEL